MFNEAPPPAAIGLLQQAELAALLVNQTASRPPPIPPTALQSDPTAQYGPYAPLPRPYAPLPADSNVHATYASLLAQIHDLNPESKKRSWSSAFPNAETEIAKTDLAAAMAQATAAGSAGASQLLSHLSSSSPNLSSTVLSLLSLLAHTSQPSQASNQLAAFQQGANLLSSLSGPPPYPPPPPPSNPRHHHLSSLANLLNPVFALAASQNHHHHPSLGPPPNPNLPNPTTSQHHADLLRLSVHLQAAQAAADNTNPNSPSGPCSPKGFQDYHKVVSSMPPELQARLRKKIRIIQPISRTWQEEALQPPTSDAPSSEAPYPRPAEPTTTGFRSYRQLPPPTSDLPSQSLRNDSSSRSTTTSPHGINSPHAAPPLRLNALGFPAPVVPHNLPCPRPSSDLPQNPSHPNLSHPNPSSHTFTTTTTTTTDNPTPCPSDPSSHGHWSFLSGPPQAGPPSFSTLNPLPNPPRASTTTHIPSNSTISSVQQPPPTHPKTALQTQPLPIPRSHPRPPSHPSPAPEPTSTSGPLKRSPPSTSFPLPPSSLPLPSTSAPLPPPPHPAATVEPPAPPLPNLGILTTVQGQLSVLYHWYIQNKSVYLEQAKQLLTVLESAQTAPASHAAPPAGAVDTSAVLKAFEKAIQIMQASQAVETRWAPSKCAQQAAATASDQSPKLPSPGESPVEAKC